MLPAFMCLNWPGEKHIQKKKYHILQDIHISRLLLTVLKNEWPPQLVPHNTIQHVQHTVMLKVAWHVRMLTTVVTMYHLRFRPMCM
jgi:hypothetical protein